MKEDFLVREKSVIAKFKSNDWLGCHVWELIVVVPVPSSEVPRNFIGGYSPKSDEFYRDSAICQ